MNRNKYFDIVPSVFYPALLIIIAFLAVALIGREFFETHLTFIHHQIADNFGWLIILCVNFF